MRHRYPFDALRWLRHKAVDETAHAVAESAKQTAAARAALAHASAERSLQQGDLSRIAAAEEERLRDGLVRAGDLRQVADFRVARETELDLALEREARARAESVAKADIEQRARRYLGTASNRAKVVDSHRDAFDAERAAQLSSAEEEAAAEQWAARRFFVRRT